MCTSRTLTLAGLLHAVVACDGSIPLLDNPSTGEQESADMASMSQVTLPRPGGERASPSEKEREVAFQSMFESAVERRIAERSGDHQAIAAVEAEEAARQRGTAAAADAALRAVVPLIEQCPGAPEIVQLSVLLDTYGLFDAWVLVHQRAELPEPFLTCAGSIVWGQDWPSSPSLKRISISSSTDQTPGSLPNVGQ